MASCRRAASARSPSARAARAAAPQTGQNRNGGVRSCECTGRRTRQYKILAMSILKVARMGHPVLRQKARPIEKQELKDPAAAEVHRRHDRHDARVLGHRPRGAAGARGRCASLSRISIPRAAARASRSAIINPQISIVGDRTVEGWEGCLSIPDIRGLVPRAFRHHVVGARSARQAHRARGQDFPARVIQHETDHLDGVLFFDRMRSFESLTYMDEFSRYHATRRRRRGVSPAMHTTLVTGGGRGIGRAIALAFAEPGQHVIVAGRTTESLRQTAAEIETRGARASAVTMDVTDADVGRARRRVAAPATASASTCSSTTPASAAASRSQGSDIARWRQAHRRQPLRHVPGHARGPAGHARRRPHRQPVVGARPLRRAGLHRVLRREARRDRLHARAGAGAGVARDHRQRARAGLGRHRDGQRRA